MDKIKIAIVDDEVLILNLLQNFFNNSEDTEVLFTCTSGKDTLATLEESKEVPDLFLLDFKMEDMNGAELTAALKHQYPTVRIIIISSYYKKSLLAYIQRNNIDAFLPKGIEPSELSRIIKIVHHRGHFFTQEQIDVMKNQVSHKVASRKFEGETLTSREKEVLTCICDQLTAKETAEHLFIAQRTVEGHRNNLLQKTGAKNIAGLVIYAIGNQLYNPNNLIM